MKRLELIFVAFCFAAWVVSLLAVAGVVDLSGSLALSRYQLFSISAAAGWLFGNIWVQRCRKMPPAIGRRFFILYFLGPPGMLYLLRAMAPATEQQLLPIVPLLSMFVFAALFLVPVALRNRHPEPPRVDLHRGRGDENRPADGDSHEDPRPPA